MDDTVDDAEADCVDDARTEEYKSGLRSLAINLEVPSERLANDSTVGDWTSTTGGASRGKSADDVPGR